MSERILLTEPNRQKAVDRFEQIVNALEGVPAVRALHGYREVQIGSLTIRVTVKP